MNMEDMERKADEAGRLLRELANAKRLMILCHLSQAELSVGALQERVGLSQSALSQHLARMRERSLVRTRRDGQTIHYALASPEVRHVIETLYAIYCVPAEAAR